MAGVTDFIPGVNVLGTAKDAVKGINDSYHQESAQGAETPAPDPNLGPQLYDSAKKLGEITDAAETSLGNIAGAEKANAKAAGKFQEDQANKINSSASDFSDYAEHGIRDSQQRTFYDLNKAEQYNDETHKLGKIDPDVFKNMPWYKQLATSIGMIFSGIGSGVTGQENLAFKQLDNYIQRNIEAQQTRYENSAKDTLRLQGLATTAQQEGDLAVLARQMANVTTLGATGTMMDAYGTKLAGTTANDRGVLAKQKVAQQYTDALANLNKLLVGHLKSNNVVTNSLVSAVAQASMDPNDKWNPQAPSGIKRGIERYTLAPKEPISLGNVRKKDTGTSEESRQLLQSLGLKPEAESAGEKQKNKVKDQAKKSLLQDFGETMFGRDHLFGEGDK